MQIGKLLKSKLRALLDIESEADAERVASGGVSLVAHPIEKAYVQQFSSETETDRLERKCREYFAVIERVVEERDEWIERYRKHVRGHQVAMGMLERREAKARLAAAALLRQLNALRDKHGADPVVLQRPEDVFGDDEKRVVKKMIEEHVQLLRELDAAFDAYAARTVIEASHSEDEQQEAIE